MPVLDKIAEAIVRHRLFAANSRVGVAVSGGADSVCLLHALVELGPRWGLRLEVLHVNHGMRGDESDGDEQFVGELAAGAGLGFHSLRVNTLARGGNLEEAARDLRRAAFREWAAAIPLDCVALAHTRGDQAETVLFRFLRGAYLTGLAGMRPKSADGLVRPMLEVDRAEVEGWLRDRGFAWREDRTNRDPAFARNRIRRELLPALVAEWNPRLRELLARHAQLAQEDEDFWIAEVGRIEGEFVAARSGGLILATGKVFDELQPAVARRLIRRVLERARGDLRGIDAAHVAQVFELCRGPSGHCRLQVPGVDILRSFDRVRFAPPSPGASPGGFELPLAAPVVVGLPFEPITVHLEIVDRSGKVQAPLVGHDTLEAELDWNRIQSDMSNTGDSKGELLLLRNWRPGDAYRPAGDRQERKLKALFHTARIPLWERRHWPILSAGRRIIWTRLFGPAHDLAAGAAANTVLRISERPLNLPGQF